MKVIDKVCISHFLESMDHEFSDSEVIISRKGYKVDGKSGIKVHCKLNELKSVDYFNVMKVKGDDFYLIEFSDLVAQDVQINDKIRRVSSSNLNGADKRKIKSDMYKEINRELVSKYKDSITLLNLIGNGVDNIPDEFNEKPKYLIVVAPIDDSKKADTARFLDSLKNKISQAIPSAIFTRVIVTPLNFCEPLMNC